MTEYAAALTAEELLHLAIADSRNGRHDEAILKLKRCIAQNPVLAPAHHLLGAERAEIGLLREAVGDLERAIGLDPTSVASRFQLGLVHMLRGEQAKATQSWASVAELDPGGPWKCFCLALECQMQKDIPTAVHHLESGLRLEFGNDALRSDMRRLRDRLIKHPSDKGDDSAASTSELLRQTYSRGDGDS